MLLLKNIPIEFSRKDILSYLGFKPRKSQINPMVDSLVEEAINAARLVIKPAVVIHTLMTEKVLPERIVFRDSDFNITGGKIVEFMSLCTRVSFIGATIGWDIENEIRQLFDAQESSRAVVMDAVGSDAVEQAVSWADALLQREAQKEGFTTLRRVSPGYGLWNIEANAAIAETVGVERIGIEVLPSYELLPRKSVIAAVGWVPRER